MRANVPYNKIIHAQFFLFILSNGKEIPRNVILILFPGRPTTAHRLRFDDFWIKSNLFCNQMKCGHCEWESAANWNVFGNRELFWLFYAVESRTTTTTICEATDRPIFHIEFGEIFQLFSIVLRLDATQKLKSIAMATLSVNANKFLSKLISVCYLFTVLWFRSLFVVRWCVCVAHFIWFSVNFR